MINLIISMLFLCSVALCSKTTIAIFDFQNNGLEPHEVRQLSKRLESELVKLRNFDVVERARIDEILKEQKLQTSGCTETCLLDVGKILGATQIVYGSIGKIGNLYTISAKLVDAETGKLIRSSDYDADYGLTQLLKHGLMIVANSLTGNQIKDNYIHSESVSAANRYEVKPTKNAEKKEVKVPYLPTSEAINELIKYRQKQLDAKPVYDIPPSPKTAIQPKYPRKALNDEIEGTVIVQAFVDMYGYVRETIVLESIRKDLDKAAAKSLKKTRFSPAKKDGNPVGVWISVPVNFKLK